MIKVLFVCLGNICRSPTAEAVFRDLVRRAGLEDKIATDSAGTGGWHLGAPADARARATARARGIDMEDLRARQFVGSDYHEFDYLLAMDNNNFQDMQLLDPGNGKAELHMMLSFAQDSTKKEVPDPYYGGIEGYELVFDMLEPAASGLLLHIRHRYSL